ncbi:MauE/DoxX family redox-associated membrane protein [Leadbetterella sp. DM7]|uniref:MauE/DoxX family redox-associated membrane protein n=1 Tax=Leadbetterella sp. DM7 TaxID=3235085 RepID=UPI00349E8052
MKRSDLQVLFAVLLIILFSYTAIAKLMDVAEFERQLAGQQLPSWAKKPLVWLIPASELLLSVLLIIPSTRRLGFYGSALLMVLFTGYVGLVVFGFFKYTPCSCGGVLRSMDFGTHLVLNLFFLTLSLLGIYMSHSKNKSAVT